MARKKSDLGDDVIQTRAGISQRIREVRTELFGEQGGPEIARRLNLPARTWYNYETGVAIPFEVLIRFLELTGTEPRWVLTGEEPKYSRDSPFVEVPLIPLESLARPRIPRNSELYVVAFPEWVRHPKRTVAVRVKDSSMHPILPVGSIAAIDRSRRDPVALDGQIVAAVIDGHPLLRWLDLSGEHLILRPNLPSPDFPMIPLSSDADGRNPIIGQVLWSWSRLGEA